jgi:chemosensory pili system protein ChpA (sensor histidine kinase/response regulator)
MDAPHTPGDAAAPHGAGHDLSTLAWVQAELRRSLEAANKALRRYLKEAEAAAGSDLNSVDLAVLRTARSQLHQGVGALELVGLPAAAALLRAAEGAVQRMVAKPALVTPAAVGTVEKASFALLDYLGRQLAGKPLSPVALFPQYRAAQQLAGADRVHPADLWPHEWQWKTLPEEPGVLPRAADTAARSAMEALVLTLMRQPDPAALLRMSDLCAGLAAGARAEPEGTTLATLWQLAAAVFQAQAAGLLGSDVYSKRLASRLLAQLKAGARGSQPPSEQLAQDLLFFCAHARPAAAGGDPAPRLTAVRSAWQLDSGPEAPVDYETARLGRFDPALVALAKKRVAGAKDAWSAVAGQELHRLVGLAEQFALVGDSVQRLFPAGEQMSQALQSAAAQTVASADAPPPALAMEVATAVLYLDACIEDGEFDQPGLAERVQRLAVRIDQVRDGADPEPLEPWMEELYRRVSDRQTMGSVVQELRASLSDVEKQIDQYFRSPAQREVLIPVPGQLSSMRGVLSVLGMDQASQAVLHMRDDVDALAQTEVDPQQAIATGTFDRLADNLGALSFLIDMLSVQPQLAKSLFRFDPETGVLSAVMGQSERVSAFADLDEAPAAAPVPEVTAGSDDFTLDLDTAPAATGPATVAITGLSLAEQARALATTPDETSAPEELAARLDQLAQQALAADQPELARTLGAGRRALGQAADDAARVAVRAELANALHNLPAVTPAPEPLPAPTPVPAERPVAPGATGLEDDAEMREIFVEEAREVVDNARAALARLADAPETASDMTELRRAFHTLKGSSRMVGLREYGEAAWGCEQLFNARLAHAARMDGALRQFTSEALTYLGDWTEAIAMGRDDGHRAAPVQQAAEALRLDNRRVPIEAPQAPLPDTAKTAAPAVDLTPAPEPEPEPEPVLPEQPSVETAELSELNELTGLPSADAEPVQPLQPVEAPAVQPETEAAPHTEAVDAASDAAPEVELPEDIFGNNDLEPEPDTQATITLPVVSELVQSDGGTEAAAAREIENLGFDFDLDAGDVVPETAAPGVAAPEDAVEPSSETAGESFVEAAGEPAEEAVASPELDTTADGSGVTPAEALSFDFDLDAPEESPPAQDKAVGADAAPLRGTAAEEGIDPIEPAASDEPMLAALADLIDRVPDLPSAADLDLGGSPAVFEVPPEGTAEGSPEDLAALSFDQGAEAVEAQRPDLTDAPSEPELRADLSGLSLDLDSLDDGPSDTAGHDTLALPDLPAAESLPDLLLDGDEPEGLQPALDGIQPDAAAESTESLPVAAGSAEELALDDDALARLFDSPEHDAAQAGDTGEGDSASTEPEPAIEGSGDSEPEAGAATDVPDGVEDSEEPMKLIGPLRISIPLFNIFLNEADEQSRRLCTEMAEWALEHERHGVPESSVALAHSLAGNSATVGFADLSALARALEHALMRSQLAGQGRAGEPGLFVDAADEIRRLLHQFAAGFLQPVQPGLMERLAEHERLPLPQDGDEVAVGAEPGEDAGEDAGEAPGDESLPLVHETASEPFAEPLADPLVEPAAERAAEPPYEPGFEPEPEVERSSGPSIFDTLSSGRGPGAGLSPVVVADFLPATSDEAGARTGARADAFDDDDGIDAVDAIDHELWPIFEEEAEELLPQLQNRLRDWLDAPGDPAGGGASMRTLHTLKGGARLAGAMRLGEMAHRLETAIEHLSSHEQVQASDIEPLLARADAMSALFETLGRPAAEPVAESAAAAPPVEPAPFAEPAREPEPAQEGAPEQAAAMPPAAEVEADAAEGALPAGEPAAVPSEEAAAERAEPTPDEAPAVAASTLLTTPTIDWGRFTLGTSAAEALPDRSAGSNAAVRVRAGLLDRLVNQAGEVSITRARIDADMRQLQLALVELTDSLDRMRRQLRDIELQAETQMSSRMEAAKAASAAFDPLEMDRFTRFQELTRFMAESVNDVATLQRGLQRTLQSTEDELAAQARLTRELQDDLLRTRMVEFESGADRLYRTVRQAAKDAGKQVRLDIVGGAIEVDRGVLERMTGPFEHLLRNSVAHGIETPAGRTAAGKDVAGHITITLAQAGNEVAVEFADDGAGLDLPRIRQRAVDRGLLAADAPASDAELAQLIFAAGFSTAEQVTELAGRGVGMDVVRAEVNAMGGRIETATSPGQGTRFRLLLPLTTAVTQVVMLRCGDLSVAVPSTLIEIVRRLPSAEVEQAYAQGHLSFGGEEVPFFWLPSLLQKGTRGETAGRTQPVVVVRSAAQRVAVHVDEVTANQEVVVKNVGSQLSRLPGLAGVTLLPSGAVALIYNPVALATLYGDDARRRALGLAQSPSGAGSADVPSAPPRAPLVLVVDDSLTVRRVTQRLLVREGYRVSLAKDGLDALEKLADERPAVLLSDIEMPRMDGFDLLRNVRADPALAGLPVVMITSRTAQKHRELAAELGADHYLGKPYGEEELLSFVAQHAGAAAPDILT